MPWHYCRHYQNAGIIWERALHEEIRFSKDLKKKSVDEWWMVHQKLGMFLENKVVQKLKLEKKVFYKKWSPKLIFLNNFFFEKTPLIFDVENWLWKYNFGIFWRTIIERRIVLKQFPLSMSILGQKSCILGPTIFKIPQPNWH